MNYLSIRTPAKKLGKSSKRGTPILSFLCKSLPRQKTEAKLIKRKSPSNPFKTSPNFDSLYLDHLYTTYQHLTFIEELKPLDTWTLHSKLVFLPPKTSHSRLLVFDLDETLVHCTPYLKSADFTITVTVETCEALQLGINVRPYALQCLKAASECFEVAVFTASLREYADAVLDRLDPEARLIHHRLYRDQCIHTEGGYVKDLRIFMGWEVNDIVIVDNSVYSFAYQLNNGVPIVTWHNDPHDSELKKLIVYLRVLAKAKDMHEINRKVFRLDSFVSEYSREYLQVD